MQRGSLARALIALFVLAGPALAASHQYNAVGNYAYSKVWDSGEPTHDEILGLLFSSTFTQVTGSPDEGPSYTDGTVTATRIPDLYYDGGSWGPGSNLNVLTGSTSDTDQVWEDGRTISTAKARYAGYDQTFGYYLGSSGGTYQPLFEVVDEDPDNDDDFGIDVDGEGEVVFSGPWRWGRSGKDDDLNTNYHSSLDAENPDEVNHMVTYRLDGVAAEDVGVWLTFWEDLNQNRCGCGSDWDYNDLVVQIIATETGTPVIPEPATMLSALLGLGALGGYLRRRHRS
jgi:hypothetical protein